MKTKKVLIIGESDMVYVKEYVENMLKFDSSFKFTILTFTKKRYLEFYKKNNIKLIHMRYECDSFEVNFQNKIILSLLRGKFNFVHVHAVTFKTLELATIIAGNSSKIIASYWGFLSSKSEVKKIEPLLNKVYKISFVTENLKEDFNKNYGCKYDNKCYCFDFGNGCISTMKNLMKGNELSNLMGKAKEELGFPTDRIIVAIGYCGRRDQQHLKVLDELEKLPKEILSKLYLFFHFSYSVTDKSYQKQIYSRLKRFDKYGCNYKISDEYMTGDRIAYLRLAVDVFINAEIMDALSGSMLEYLFGGTLVFNPEWLDYSVLERNGVFYIKYDDLDDLPNKFIDNINGIKALKHNRKPIWDMCSWNKLVKKWYSLYD